MVGARAADARTPQHSGAFSLRSLDRFARRSLLRRLGWNTSVVEPDRRRLPHTQRIEPRWRGRSQPGAPMPNTTVCVRHAGSGTRTTAAAGRRLRRGAVEFGSTRRRSAASAPCQVSGIARHRRSRRARIPRGGGPPRSRRGRRASSARALVPISPPRRRARPRYTSGQPGVDGGTSDRRGRAAGAGQSTSRYAVGRREQLVERVALLRETAPAARAGVQVVVAEHHVIEARDPAPSAQSSERGPRFTRSRQPQCRWTRS